MLGLVGYKVRHAVTHELIGKVVAVGTVGEGEYAGFWVLVRHESGRLSQWPAEFVEVLQ